MIAVPMRVATDVTAVPMTVSSEQVSYNAKIGCAYVETSYPDYSGPYIFTPSQEAQTIQTADEHLLRNIVINPIPQNYGLITYNGSTLTVS